MKMLLRSLAAKEIDPALRNKPGLSLFNIIVCFLIVFSIAVTIIRTESNIYLQLKEIFFLVDVVLVVFFTLEYFLRIWVSIENPAFSCRIKFMLNPASLFDLLAILVVVLDFFASTGFFFRLARLLRIVRIAKFGRFSIALKSILMAISQRSYELGLSVGASVIVLVISSALLYVVEGGVQPDSFGSIPRAMWWSVATLTTVGYGDVYPVTTLGKVFAAITAISGIGLIAMPTGILASAFSDAFQQQAKETRECLTTEHNEK
jgi:voltage-gated potassium channel